ncbi:MAG: hypothetical protein ACR2FY_26145 [Pirellulaceae bacterium]
MDLRELQKNKQTLVIGGAALAGLMLFTCCLTCGVASWIFPSSRTSSGGRGGGSSAAKLLKDDPKTPPRGTSKHGKPLSNQQLKRAISGNRYTTKETLILGTDDADQLLPGSLRVSPDGSRYAYVLKSGSSHKVMLDGKPHVTVPAVNLATMFFSTDGRHFLFAPTEGGKYFIDGKENDVLGQSLSPKVHSLVASDDASQVAAVVTASQYEWHLVVGKSSVVTVTSYNNYPPFSVVTAPIIRWHQIATVEGGMNAIVDGKKGPIYSSITAMALAGRSTSAYIASRDNKQFLVYNGQEKKLHDGVGSFQLSPDGKRFAYWATVSADAAVGRAAANKLYVDDEQMEHYATSFVFSPDSAHWAGVENLDYNEKRAVLDDQHFKRYLSCSQPVFTPDGRNLAYVASATFEKLTGDTKESVTRQFAVFNGYEQQPYTFVSGSIVFSPKSDAYAYVARKEDGKAYVVVNGHEGPAWDDFQFAADKRPILSFSQDGRSIGYVAKVGDFWAAVLDGKQSKTFDQIGPEGTRIGFTPSGSFSYIAVRKGAFYWVEEQTR